MFRILIVLFFILVQSSDEIKAISYNIRYNNPKDGMNVWENRKATVMGLLNEQSADFVGLQEVVHAQLLDLVEGLPTYNYVGIGRKDGKTKGEYSPIFFKKDKYSVLQSNTFWLSETPDLVSKGWDASLERICTYGLFENKKNQKKVWVFNTHLDHRGVKARAKSVDLIIEKVKSLNEENYPVIVTGDFNLTPDTSPIQKMQSHFLDFKKNLTPTDANFPTANSFNNQSRGVKRIDYVFVKGLKPIKAKHLYQKTPMGGWASDHHPVVVHLKQR